MYSIIFNSLLAGLATILGCLIILLLGNPGEKVLAWLLGLASGIMLLVVILDLLPSAYVYSNFSIALLGFFLGHLLLLSLDIFLTQLPFLKEAGNTDNGRLIKMGYLIAVGIALHDLPEGIAIAAGYSATAELGLIIALAIGLHNIPEGMATAAPLKMGGMKNWKIFLLITLVSFITPFGAYLGCLIIGISKSLIGLLLAFAAGAMTFIVNNELWPESKKHHPNYSRLGAFSGIVIMLLMGLLH